MDNPNFIQYQVTTRTANRFSQLDRWMQSNTQATIIIPGFHIDTDGTNKSYLDETSDLFIRNQDALIEINNINHYHILGINSNNRKLVQTITYCIKKLVSKYTVKIVFGLVGKDTTFAPQPEYIHLWESNESNIAPDIITKITREDMTNTRAQFTYENTYIFGINTTIDNELAETSYRTQTASLEYPINYFNSSYIYDPSVIPTSYSRYKNFSNSCYFAGLWAFLHKPENPVTESILEQLKKNLGRDQNQITLISYLNQYYLNIHTLNSNESRSKFEKDLGRFRNFLERSLGFNASREQDSHDLITIIGGEIENTLFNNPIESFDENYFPSNDTNIISTSDSNITYSMDYYYGGENNFLAKKKNDPIKKTIFPLFIYDQNNQINYDQENNLIIVGNQLPGEEDVNKDIYIGGNIITHTHSNGRKFSIKKTVQFIYKPTYFSIYNKRFLVLGSKDTTEYPIVDNYSQFELYSIVVHGGSARGGHYTCYFKHGSIWYIFNDCGANISTSKNPINEPFIRSNWVLLVYFKQNLSNVPFIDIPIPNHHVTEKYSPTSNISNQISQDYKLKPITLMLLASLVTYLMGNDDRLSSDEKKTLWLIGGLSIVISELVSPEEGIEITVSKFINNLFKLIGSINQPMKGGGDKNKFIDYIIEKVSLILNEWYYKTDKSDQSLKQIIEKFKLDNGLIKQLELAELVKSPEYTLNLINSYKTNLTKLNIQQQIKLLRGLKWKVNMTPLGPLLIDWDQWIKLNPQLKQIINSNPWIKYQIQSYIYNINLNHSNLLTGK